MVVRFYVLREAGAVSPNESLLFVALEVNFRRKISHRPNYRTLGLRGWRQCVYTEWVMRQHEYMINPVLTFTVGKYDKTNGKAYEPES